MIRDVGRYSMPALFLVLTAAFVVIAFAAADHGQWVIAVASAALALWMAQFAWSAMKKSRTPPAKNRQRKRGKNRIIRRLRKRKKRTANRSRFQVRSSKRR